MDQQTDTGISTRLSFTDGDGTWTSLSITPPFGATETEIEAHIAQAILQLRLMRRMAHPAGEDSLPCNMPMPFGTFKGQTVAMMVALDRQKAEFFAYQADRVDQPLREAIIWTLEHFDALDVQENGFARMGASYAEEPPAPARRDDPTSRLMQRDHVQQAAGDGFRRRELPL